MTRNEKTIRAMRMRVVPIYSRIIPSQEQAVNLSLCSESVAIVEPLNF